MDQCAVCHGWPQPGQMVVPVSVIVPVNAGMNLGLAPAGWMHLAHVPSEVSK